MSIPRQPLDHMRNPDGVCVAVYSYPDDTLFKRKLKVLLFFLNKVKLKSLCRYAEELVPIF